MVYLKLRKLLKLFLSCYDLCLDVDGVDLVVYFQFLLIGAEIFPLPDVAVDRQHEVVAFDVLSKEVESGIDAKNTSAGSWRFILRPSHRR